MASVNKPDTNSIPKTLSAKGQKARAKLKSAAIEVLEELGYHKMRITDVTQKAGVASGLFYHYFPDLQSLTREVLEDFVATAQNIEKIEKNVIRGDWFGRILAHNTLVVRSYSRHPGMMRCLLQLADEDSEFSALLRKGYIEQLRWLTRKMPGLFPDAGFSHKQGEHQALMVVYALSGMAETLLRDYYINNEAFLQEQPLSDEAVAELLSVIFYRGLFLEQPPVERLKYSRNLHYMRKSSD